MSDVVGKTVQAPPWHPSPSDWEHAHKWAAILMQRKGWVILDTETTGLDDEAECVQIAVLAPDGEVLLDTLLKPKAAIPEDVTALHGITDERVADAPSFPDVWPKLKALLDGKLIVAYNVRFDRRMLDQSAAAYDLHAPEIYHWRWACAMEVYAAYCGERNGRGGYRWQKLPVKEGAHDAVADCRATLDLIRLMAEGGR